MKKLTFIFSALLILGLVIGAYALSTRSVAKTDCCAKDSCPMKSKDKNASDGKTSGCCDCSCCKDGECPMKSKDSAKTENATGCCPCCGDSCPMKSKENSPSAEKKDCCKDKESCPMKKKEKV